MSNTKHAARAAWLGLSTACLVLLTGCGGGGGGGDSSRPTAAPTSVTFVASNDQTTAASFSVPTNGSSVPPTQVAAGSTARLTVPLSELSSGSASGTTDPQITVIFSAPNHKSQFIGISRSTVLRGGEISVRPAGPFEALTPNILVATEAASFVRLGDGIDASGTYNAYLQTPAPPRNAPILTRYIALGSVAGVADGAGDVSTGYDTVTLSARFRGLQIEECHNGYIKLFQSTAATEAEAATASRSVEFTFNTTSTPPLLNSPSDGTLGEILLTTSAAGMTLAQGQLWVEVKTSDCGNPAANTSQLDDFEFVDL